MKNYTSEIIERLSNAFNAICNQKDWKAPIDAEIDIISCGFSLDDAMEAVRFYTATDPSVSQTGQTTYRIRSIGYRLGPAGDC